jgi:uncharacterized protein
MKLPDNIPIFPLNLVLFPNMEINLHIFEDRYKDMVDFCIKNNCPVGIMLIKSGQEVGEYAIPYNIGTAGYINDNIRNTDGTIDILITGKAKFEIKQLTYNQPYLSANIQQSLPSIYRPGTKLLDQLKGSVEQMQQVITKASGGWMKKVNTKEDPYLLTLQAINLLLENFSLPNTVKQNMLENQEVNTQIETLLPILDESIKLLNTEVQKNYPYSGFSKN